MKNGIFLKNVARYDGKNPLHVILRSLVRAEKTCCFLSGGFDTFKDALEDWVFVPDVVYGNFDFFLGWAFLARIAPLAPF